MKIKSNKESHFFLHRALSSVLIDGDGEFGDESTLGFEYWFWWSRIVGGRDSIGYPCELFNEDVNWLGEVVEELRWYGEG